MGISILEQVLQQLRSAHFQADVAYPGQKYPQITDTVAAVHIEKVERANMTVTLEVNIITPAALGGTACELEALRATEVLQLDGAVCVQNGCTYDGASQVYVVAVLATYTCVTEADRCVVGPGFEVYINDQIRYNACYFADEEVHDHKLEYAMGESWPVGTSRGSHMIQITLEERIPPEAPDEPVEEPFALRVKRQGGTDTFDGCRWISVRREMDNKGLRQIRKGIAAEKRVN